MKRSIKNTLMAVLLAVALVGTYFTMASAKNLTATGNSSDIPSFNGGQSAPTSQSDSGISTDSSATPPDMPSDSQSGSSGQSTPPDMPSGSQDGGSGMMPAAASGSTELTAGYYVLFAAEGLVIAVTAVYLVASSFNKKSFKQTFATTDKLIIGILVSVILTAGITVGDAAITKNYFMTSGHSSNQPSAPSDSSGGGSSSVTYSAATELTSDTTIDSGSYSSTASNENAISVSGAIKVAISGADVTKSGDADSGDNSNFYGTNSAIIAKDGASLVISNVTVTTDADGANGVFCYGGSATTTNSSSDGTTVTISDSTITTTGDNAGGIMTTGGGTTNATDLTINTAGTSSAAIRTDRGGGTVTVDGGTYTTTGKGSPAIYSTADITVSNAALIAKASEGVVIEGKNSVTLTDCQLTDSNTDLNGQSTTYKNVFLYQSNSGDADTGSASFTATGCTITTNNGDSFYVTNTTAQITLTNNVIINNDSSANFLRIQKDSWGSEGSNGGDVTLLMSNQSVEGNIVVDSISALKMTLQNGSSYTGAINTANSASALEIILDSESTLTLTADSYVTALTDADASYSNINFNGFTLYVNGQAIN